MPKEDYRHERPARTNSPFFTFSRRRGSTPGLHHRARQIRRRSSLVLRLDDRRLLSAFVPVTHSEPEECHSTRYDRKRASRIIEESGEEPSLEHLAAIADRSTSYFHRIFKASTGLTPKVYAAGDRAKKVRQGLETGTSVTKLRA
jgi:transcriptional regulator GlxA family with amidase domain